MAVFEKARCKPATATHDVARAVNDVLACENIAPIPAEAAFYSTGVPGPNGETVNILEFMRDCSQNPWTWSADKYVACKLLVREEVKRDRMIAKFYLRREPFTNRAHLIRETCDYAFDYPAEIPFCVGFLARCDATFEQIKAAVKRSLTRCNKLGAALTYLEWLAKQDLASLSLSLPCDKSLHVPYPGTTLASNVQGRMEDDRDRKMTRFLNWRATRGNNTRLDALSIPCLDIPLQHELQHRTDRAVSYPEHALIALCRGACFNSAAGGWVCSYEPPKALDDAVTALLRRAPPVPIIPVDPSIRTDIDRLFDDEVALWARLLPNSRPIDRNALEDAKVAASAGFRIHNKVLHATFMKDISAEAHRGRSRGNIHSAYAGSAFSYARRLRFLIDDTSPEAGNIIDTAVMALHFPCHIDFCRFILLHFYRLLLNLLHSRIQQTLRPLFVTVWANGLLESFVRGSFANVWRSMQDHAPPAVVDAFQAGQSPDDPAALLPDLGEKLNMLQVVRLLCTPLHDPDQQQCPHYIEHVGTLRPLQYGPNDAHWSLGLIRRDLGSHKYDPSITRRALNADFLIEALQEYCKRVVFLKETTDPMPDGADTYNWVVALKEQVETTLEEVGFAAELATAKGALAVAQTSLGVLRSAQRRPSTSRTYLRETGLVTAADAVARLAQLVRIRKNDQLDRDLGRPYNARGLIPFGMNIYSTDYASWFQALPPGREVIYLVNGAGKTAEAQNNSRVNRQRFAVMPRK